MKRKLFSMIVALLLPLAALGESFTFEVGNLSYTTIEDYPGYVYVSSLIDRDEFTGSITIPSTIPYGSVEYIVAYIDHAAFYNTQRLESVTIGEGITSIGSSAFQKCPGLRSVTLPQSLLIIGEEAFMECEGLKSIDIPDAVTEVGYRAFRACYNLEEITLGEGIEIIHDGTFDGCNKIQRLTINTKNLPAYAFDRNGSPMIQVTFGPKVETIGMNAFYGSPGIREIALPENISKVESNAFGNCESLTEVSVWGRNTDIHERAFWSSPVATVYTNQETVVGFKDLTELTDITFGDDVRVIGKNAFYGCKALTELELPEKLEGIGYGSFFDCKGLEKVTMYDNVTYIDPLAFCNCTSLFTVRLSTNLETIYEKAFYGCTMLGSLETPESLKSIGSRAFQESGITSAILNEGLETISSCAFYYCQELKTLVLPSTLKSIGSGAFSVSNALESITARMPTPLDGSTTEWFSDYRYSEATLYVPQSAIDAYKKTVPWKYFKKMEGIPEEHSLEASVELLDANGQLVEGTTAHLSVKVSNKGTKDYYGPLTATIVKKVEEEWVYVDDKPLKTPIVVGIDNDEQEVWFEGLEKDGIYEVIIWYESMSEQMQAGKSESFQMVEPSFDLEATVNVTGLIDSDEGHYLMIGDVAFDVSIFNPSGFLYEGPVLLKLVTHEGQYAGELERTASIESAATKGLTASFEASAAKRGETYYVDVYYLRKGKMESCGHSEEFTMVQFGLHELKGTVSLVKPIVTDEGALQVGDKQTVYLMIQNNTTAKYEADMTLRLMQKNGDTWQQVGQALEYVTLEGLKNGAVEHTFEGLESGNEYRVEAYYYSLDQLTLFGISSSWRMVDESPTTVTFKDPEVEKICLANWDTDFDGLLSYEEAAAVKDLGKAFMRNDGITSFDELKYFTGLKSIRTFGFSECNNLVSVTIPANVATIEEGAFWYCTGLTQVTIEEGVTLIEKEAFSNCSSLEVVIIPASMTFIDNFAFFNCTGLKTVVCLVKEPFEIYQTTFMNEDPDTYERVFTDANLYVSAGCKSKYMQTYYWNSFKNIRTLGGEDETEPGDANGDSEVNVADVDYVIERIGEACDDTNKAADVNGDGEINVADVDYIIERIK